MALNKVTYEDNVTVIYAQNLNEIQDEVIRNAGDITDNREAIADLQTSKQDVLSVDGTPTENSTNPVSSGGVYTALLDLEYRFTGENENLLVNATWTDDFYIDQNGDIQINANLRYSSLLPVRNGIYSYVYKPKGSNYNTRIHGYDSDGNWVAQVVSDAAGTGVNVKVVSFLSQDIAYVRVSTAKTTMGDAVSLSYSLENIERTSDELSSVHNHIELLDIVSAETIPYTIGAVGKFVRADTGAEGTGQNHERTGFVNIDGYEYLIYSNLYITPATTTGGMAFYSTENTSGFLSGIYLGTGAETTHYEVKIVKIPTEAKYARFTTYKNLGGFYVKGIRPNPLKGLKLSLLGDSVSTFTDYIPEGNQTYYTGSNAGVKSVNDMWWKILCNNTGMEPLVIDAWSGTAICYNFATDSAHSDTVKIPMCSDMRTERLSAGGINPDVIIVAGGLNDYLLSKQSTTPLGTWNGRTAISRSDVVSGQSTFMESYASMIDKLHQNYPSAIVVCASLYYTKRGTSLGVTYVNDVGFTENDYNQAIKNVCEIMGVPYIDIYNVGFTFENVYPTYIEDSEERPTHPNAAGQAVIARRFIEELPKLVKQFM